MIKSTVIAAVAALAVCAPLAAMAQTAPPPTPIAYPGDPGFGAPEPYVPDQPVTGPAIYAAPVPVALPPGAVWLPGQYSWDASRQKYLWVEGQYVLPPRPNAQWIEGHWVETPTSWIWMDGRWN
jgi:hypothetical protein